VNGLSLAMLALAPCVALAQSSNGITPDLSPENLDACTLIENGVERLACYDDFAAPEQTFEYEKTTRPDETDESDPDYSGKNKEDSAWYPICWGVMWPPKKQFFRSRGVLLGIGRCTFFLLPI